MSYWTDRAACAGRDPRLWDPPSDVKPSHAARRYAVAICSRCPVADQCATEVTADDCGSIRAGRVVDGHGQLQPLRPPRKPSPPLAPCGTPSAVDRHRRRGEACADCRVRADGTREPHPGISTAVCGSSGAWARHRRRDESCFTCWPETGRPRPWRRAA